MSWDVRSSTWTTVSKKPFVIDIGVSSGAKKVVCCERYGAFFSWNATTGKWDGITIFNPAPTIVHVDASTEGTVALDAIGTLYYKKESLVRCVTAVNVCSVSLTELSLRRESTAQVYAESHLWIRERRRHVR